MTDDRKASKYVQQNWAPSCAKELLKEGNAALAAGVFGAGRKIHLEAATPGEIKAGGEGWTIVAGFAASPFGMCFIAESSRGICRLSFVDSSLAEVFAALGNEWPNAVIERNDGMAVEWCRKVFVPCSGGGGNALDFPFSLYVKGTVFQVRIWQALLRLPEGNLVSYGDLANFIGNPGASRAVGTAVGKNPIAYLIPCHRVIRENGEIGGYRWGTDRKCEMLAREGCFSND